MFGIDLSLSFHAVPVQVVPLSAPEDVMWPRLVQSIILRGAHYSFTGKLTMLMGLSDFCWCHRGGRLLSCWPLTRRAVRPGLLKLSCHHKDHWNEAWAWILTWRLESSRKTDRSKTFLLLDFSLMWASIFLSYASLRLRVSFLCFCFYPTQLANVVYFILSKRWLIQELVLKETPFLSNPLSQCCFFSRTHDSHGCRQGCSSFTRQNFSATHLILEVTQEPVWVGSITLSHHPISWYWHLLAVGPWKTLSQPLPSFLTAACCSFSCQQFSCAAILEEGSCLPMVNVGIIS